MGQYIYHSQSLHGLVCLGLPAFRPRLLRGKKKQNQKTLQELKKNTHTHSKHKNYYKSEALFLGSYYIIAYNLILKELLGKVMAIAVVVYGAYFIPKIFP